MVKEKNEEKIDSWTITVGLDIDVIKLSSWDAEVKEISSKKFVLTNNGWNGPTAVDMVRSNTSFPLMCNKIFSRAPEIYVLSVQVSRSLS